MKQEEWENSTQKNINFMTNNVWNGITQTAVDKFLINFKDNRKIGLALLEMLIFYSQEQEILLATSLLKQLRREIWLDNISTNTVNFSNSKNINTYIDDYLQKSYFIPLDKDDPSGSAYSLSAIYKKIKDFPKTNFIEVEEIPLMIASQKKCFIFYDDIIGTGTQFTTFWNHKYHFGKNKISPKQLAKLNPDIKFYYLVFGANKEKLETLRAANPEIKILTAETYELEDSILSPDNEYWDINKSMQEEVIQYIENKLIELKVQVKHTLNIPILFEHCRAQNTALPLYWLNNPNWNALYKR